MCFFLLCLRLTGFLFVLLCNSVAVFVYFFDILVFVFWLFVSYLLIVGFSWYLF